MRPLALLSFAASTVLFATGCSFDMDMDSYGVAQGPEQQVRVPAIDFSGGSVEQWEGGSASWLDFDGASLAGDLPSKGAFDQADGYGSLYMDRWEDNTHMNLNINVEGDGGWAMIGVTMAVDEAGMATYHNTDMIGCDYDFDAAPMSAEVTMEPIRIDGEEWVEITLAGDFDGNHDAVGVVYLPGR